MQPIGIGAKFVNKNGDGYLYRVDERCGRDWWHCSTVEKHQVMTLDGRVQTTHISRVLSESVIKDGLCTN